MCKLNIINCVHTSAQGNVEVLVKPSLDSEFIDCMSSIGAIVDIDNKLNYENKYIPLYSGAANTYSLVIESIMVYAQMEYPDAYMSMRVSSLSYDEDTSYVTLSLCSPLLSSINNTLTLGNSEDFYIPTLTLRCRDVLLDNIQNVRNALYERNLLPSLNIDYIKISDNRSLTNGSRNVKYNKVSK